MIFQRNPYVVGSNPTRPAYYHGTKIGPTSCHHPMQISLEGIQKREDPYQLFLDSLSNKETRRKEQNIASNKENDTSKFMMIIFL